MYSRRAVSGLRIRNPVGTSLSARAQFLHAVLFISVPDLLTSARPPLFPLLRLFHTFVMRLGSPLGLSPLSLFPSWELQAPKMIF